MGGVFCAVADGAQSITGNPATLSRVNHAQLTGSVCFPFMLKELQSQVVSVLVSTAWGGLGAGYHCMGTPNYYQEQQAVAAYATPWLWSRVALGGALRYAVLAIRPEYGADWTLLADTGVLLSIRQRLTLGGVIKNWAASRISVENEQLPRIMAAGVAVRPVEQLLVAVDAYRDLHYPTQVRIGQELTMAGILAVRAGIQTQPARFSAGCGIHWKDIRIDYGFVSHYALGASHQVTITVGK
jgi:hypothetical protein